MLPISISIIPQGIFNTPQNLTTCDGLITRPEESYCVSNSVWLINLKRGGQGPIWTVAPLDGWKILRHGADGFTSTSKEVVLWNFVKPKYPSLSAGFEHANLGSSGKHDKHYTTYIYSSNTGCSKESNPCRMCIGKAAGQQSTYSRHHIKWDIKKCSIIWLVVYNYVQT
jgi:hypothetical protein